MLIFCYLPETSTVIITWLPSITLRSVKPLRKIGAKDLLVWADCALSTFLLLFFSVESMEKQKGLLLGTLTMHYRCSSAQDDFNWVVSVQFSDRYTCHWNPPPTWLSLLLAAPEERPKTEWKYWLKCPPSPCPFRSEFKYIIRIAWRTLNSFSLVRLFLRRNCLHSW